MKNSTKSILIIVVLLVLVGGLFVLFSGSLSNNSNDGLGNQTKLVENSSLDNSSNSSVSENSNISKNSLLSNSNNVNKNNVKKNNNKNDDSKSNSTTPKMSKKEAYTILKNKFNSGNYKVHYYTGKLVNGNDVQYWQFLIYSDLESDTEGGIVCIDVESKRVWGSW